MGSPLRELGVEGHTATCEALCKKSTQHLALLRYIKPAGTRQFETRALEERERDADEFNI